MLRFESEFLQDLSRSLSAEWLETNGLGGYAMGTVAGANTRRYHGLLCAAVRPPVDRRMFLNRVEDRIVFDGQECHLSCNLYGDVVHPRGHEYLSGFRLDPWPVWTYETPCATVEKSLIMPHGRNAVILRYTCLESPSPVHLRVRPLLSWRDHHHLGRASVDFALDTMRIPGGVRLLAADGPSLVFQVGEGALWSSTEWYYGFTYPEERARGLDYIEDLYSPGEAEWTLCAGQSLDLSAWVNGPPDIVPAEAIEAERARRAAIADAAGDTDDVARTLFLAADQFVVERSIEGRTARSVIAGYPWFTDWGRDTMIALPGLLLTTGRHADARSVLVAYAESMHHGLIPNMFPDQSNEAAYNTVDATLWFFSSARAYYDATGDLDLFRDLLLGRFKESLAAHIEGTDFRIKMDEDGLIEAGDETTQLTWMDAKISDWVVTPRHGKPVEINALWYSALRITEFFARKLDEDPRPYATLARRVKDGFVATFWSEELGYLYDCVRGTHRDASLRPNQVIALALPYSALSLSQERSILRAVTENLLTPCGLRTLAQSDSAYRGRYEGDQWSRDGAYHQGTVWPWPLGAYLTAYLIHAGRSDEARKWVRELIDPLIRHLGQAGLGSVSEIFDGDAPHYARGCPAQAWSVAELLRVWVQFGLGEVEFDQPG